jgi:LCP family protein required for cell wall assembly
MAESPGSSGRGDEPDYNWLYGKQRSAGKTNPERSDRSRPETTRPVRRQGGSASSEATQVMPTSPPPGGRAGGGTRPPSRTATPSPGRIAPTPGSPRTRRRWLRPRNVLLAILALLLVWIIAVVWVGVSAWNGVDKVAWEPSGTRPADQPGTNYLIVASDSRAGLSKKQRQQLHTGNAAGQRTDTIKLLHTGSGPNLLLTIPRDSYVPIPRHESSKINAAFAWGGPKLLVKTIEHNTGIHIDGYVEIGMGGLVNLVDAVGGVTICPKTNMNDPLAGLHVKKGCQHADGVKALAYSRSRHAQQLGDLGRGEAQSEVIGQIGHRVSGVGTLINPFKIHSLGSAVSSGIKVGDGMSAVGAARFLMAFKSIANGSAKECGVPIRDMYIHWDEDRSKQMFTYIKENKTGDIPKGLCTPSGLPKSVTG